MRKNHSHFSVSLLNKLLIIQVLMQCIYYRPFHGYEHSIVTISSLTFLIARFTTMCLTAANVNTASSVPASGLYKVPTCSYSMEVCLLFKLSRLYSYFFLKIIPIYLPVIKVSYCITKICLNQVFIHGYWNNWQIIG